VNQEIPAAYEDAAQREVVNHITLDNFSLQSILVRQLPEELFVGKSAWQSRSLLPRL